MKFFVIIFLGVIIVGIIAVANVLCMMYGWGLTPQSWWWIFGVAGFNWFMSTGLSAVLQMMKDRD